MENTDLPALIPSPSTREIAAELSQLMAEARSYAQKGKADSTLKIYRRDWRHFTGWCAAHGQTPLPATAETVALYITDQARRLKVSTLNGRLAAIAQAHRISGYESPTTSAPVQAVMRGIRRTKGMAQTQKTPTVTATIRSMLGALKDTPIGRRDRALLLLGYAGALRRSELVVLTMEDVEETSEGLIVTLRRSKTDQESIGRVVGIPYGSDPGTCPVRSLRAWLKTAQITEGPLFRPINRHGHIAAAPLLPKAVALIIKRTAESAGLDPGRYAGHSLRAGFATQAAQGGASERSIMEQTGHHSVLQVREYIRHGTVFMENAATRLGL
jgi:site-specific recombinase XerD